MKCARGILFFSLAIPVAGSTGELGLPDAAEAQDAALVQHLFKKGAAVNATQVDGMTTLHWAAYHDDAELGLLLLNDGANASSKNRYGITPLHLACLNGNAQFIGALIEHGADPDSSIPGGETALMTAARTGKPRAVEVLLHAGAKVDGKERNGQTAVMWAAVEGHTPVVRALVEAGADFNLSLERSGFTAFYFAIREGRTEVVNYLLSRGADVNGAMLPDSNGQDFPRRGTSPLLLAVENGHYDLAVALLDARANAHDTRTGFSILHALTWIRRPDIGEGAAGDPAPRGSGRRNSLQFARKLIQHGAKVNFQLERGRKAGGARVSEIGATPLFMAADRADLAYMKLLVELGADPLLSNNDGTTPLMVAAGIGSQAPEEEAGDEAECLAAVKYLVSLGAKVNTVDKNGETAMHGAAYKNIPAVVQYLDSVGHDIEVWNTLNRNKRTPLLIAEGYRPGNFKPCFRTVEVITKVMLSHGVKLPTGPKPKHTNYN
ncbi:MAG: ankyrin repeat domain-containing protein [Verrucomicrobiota bacterium]|jgi:ankyrin repeat protein|nr:ankyrin repeat domain-containing protein [Verrucomicrobiota bacterium]MDP7049695.1 ankyrin repeat domain-containing protein [Verrucomicrobiota bacterium]